MHAAVKALWNLLQENNYILLGNDILSIAFWDIICWNDSLTSLVIFTAIQKWLANSNLSHFSFSHWTYCWKHCPAWWYCPPATWYFSQGKIYKFVDKTSKYCYGVYKSFGLCACPQSLAQLTMNEKEKASWLPFHGQQTWTAMKIRQEKYIITWNWGV